MKRIKKAFSLLLTVCLLSSSVVVYAAESESEPTMEEVLKQLEELKKENEELKAKLAEVSGSETEALSLNESEIETEIEMADDVASADTTIEYTDVATIQMVQIALNEAGYNCGTADGKAGPKTHEQVTAYQNDKGLTANGLITEQLIVSLGLSDKVAENAKAEAEKATYSTDYSYDQLARTPDTYKGAKVKFSGKVLQAQEDSDSDLGAMILTVNSNYDNVYVIYTLSDLNFRVLDDDNVTIYGTAQGMYSYETVRGNTLTIPLLYADYVELN